MLESIKADLKLEQIYGVHCLSDDVQAESKIEEIKSVLKDLEARDSVSILICS